MEENEVEIVDFTNIFKEHCQVEELTEVQHEENEVFPDISLVEQLESKLSVGQMMTSVDDAYLLYCSYGHAKGFSVKKGAQRYFAQTRELQSKVFECSCEGIKDDRCSRNKMPAYLRPSTRTNCKARLKITREIGGVWKVSRFEKEHNHEMLNSKQRHLLRSSRNISYAKSLTLKAMVNAGISVVNAVSYMENEAQGPEFMGFTRKDAYNHLDRMKRHTKVENGDATALIQYFINKSNKEFDFYWNVQVDDEDRVMNFFFRDHRCLVDFEYFGDVMSFDTTYKTNRYNLVCAPFVGINHHKQSILFGLAFMSDETESSFEWLFSTFLDSMNGKQPETIFTDQCQAMINAIETVFTDSHHRLCQWHIDQNAPSHLGSLNADRMFKELWHKCMKKCDSVEEFEFTWRCMIDKYNLSGHKWLNNMYKIRHKWATAFSNDKFSAGLLATSRSESTNAALKKAGSSTITLYDFVLNFEKILNSWRTTESNEDARCLLGKPSSLLKGNPFLAQVADIYTLNIYKIFEEELMKCLNMTVVGQPVACGNDLFEFKVKSCGESSTIKQVVFDQRNCVLKCSCHKFETMGILCKHAMKVLNFVDIDVLPDCYIKRRWMKNAKNRVLGEVSEVVGENSDASDVVFVNQIMRSMYDLSVQCKGKKDAKNILTKCLEIARQELNVFFDKLVINDQSNFASGNLVDAGECNKIDDIVIRNPQCAKTKGISSSQIIRHWDKSKRAKGNRKVNRSNAKVSRKKGRSSTEETHIQTSQVPSHMVPPQAPILNSGQYFPFASLLEINQPRPYVQYPMQGSGNIHAGLSPHPFGYPYPSQV